MGSPKRGRLLERATIPNRFPEATKLQPTISNRRLKENIADAPNYLDKLLKIPIREYSFKTDNLTEANDIGVISQEIEPYFPELVYEDYEGNMAVTYSKFTPMLIKAIQEQQQMIDDLQRQLDEVKSKQPQSP